MTAAVHWIQQAPDRWTRGRLKNLIAKAANGTWGSDPAEDGSDVRCVRAADFDRPRRRVRIDNAPLRRVDASSLRQYLLRPGDLILEKSGGGEKQPVGMAVLFEGPEKSVCSNFCARLSPAAGVDPRFLTYVLAAAYGQGLTQSAIKQTTGIQNLDTGTFFSSLWAYPRQEEQCRIADFLDAETARIDGLVTRRREMTDLLALKRERVVELALGLEHDSHAHDMAPLKYLVEGITVGIVITPAKWYVESGGTPALRGLNVRPGVIEDSDLVRISDEGDAENVKSRLRAGDVVVVRTGQAGAAAVVPPHLAGANCIDLIVVRPGRSMAPRYLEYVLNSQYAQAHVSEHAVGSIQAHFNIGSMKKIPVPSLPLARQERIVKALDERVAGLDALKDKFQQQGQMLAERRQALITAAVTGQFDVSTASGRNNTEGISA